MRNGASARDYGTEDDYGPSPRARAQLRQLAQQYNLREVNAWPIQTLSVHCVVFAAQHHVDMAILLALLRQDLRVESAQALQKFATLSTGDARTANVEPYAHLQANLAPMEVMQAHKVTRGDGVRIAVIDSGVDTSHPDLKGRIAEQRDFAGSGLVAAVPQPVPAEKHGTAVAGIIAARDDNQTGIVGVAPAAKLLALRACWPSEANGARAVCNSFTLAQALSAAIELRADVVNLSLSGPADPLLTRLVNAGIERGITYVGAMPSAAPAGFPAHVPGVSRVVSTASGASAASDSLRAPGDDLLTLTPAGGYDFLSGSSLAAANVTGGVALLLSRRPRLKSAAVNEALSASMRGERGVNLCAALIKVDKAASCDRE
jgi:subtilisin family serine protease